MNWQARSYLQSLPYKPKIPWSKLYPNADPKVANIFNYIDYKHFNLSQCWSKENNSFSDGDDNDEDPIEIAGVDGQSYDAIDLTEEEENYNPLPDTLEVKQEEEAIIF